MVKDQLGYGGEVYHLWATMFVTYKPSTSSKKN